MSDQPAVPPGYVRTRPPVRRGAPVDPRSARQRQPWDTLGIGEATYYRRQRARESVRLIVARLRGVPEGAVGEADLDLYLRIRRAAAILQRPVEELWGVLVST